MSSTKTLLSNIAAMEAQLAEMKALLGADTKPVKTTKTKKEKDPDAPKKEPNVWIKFTQRVSAVLKAAEIKTGAATASKQFAAMLIKDEKKYDWADEEIVAAWGTWEKPAESKMAEAKRKASVSSGEEANAPPPPIRTPPLSDDEEAPAEEAAKPKRTMSDEAKAKAKATRDAKKAAKEAEPKVSKGKKEPKYTTEQLREFDPFTYEGHEDYSVNVAGDAIDGDSKYLGHWDGKTLTKGEPPAYWSEMEPASDEE